MTRRKISNTRPAGRARVHPGRKGAVAALVVLGQWLVAGLPPALGQDTEASQAPATGVADPAPGPPDQPALDQAAPAADPLPPPVAEEAEPASAEGGQAAAPARDDATGAGRDADEVDVCSRLDDTPDNWLDRAQEVVYLRTCNTAAWFDGFFGDKRYDAASSETYGRLGVSTFWDERDGWDHKLRLRARFALPALNERTSLLVGRGDEREIIEERSNSDFDSLPGSFERLDEDSVLVGLGYGKGGIRRGWRFSVGAKIRTPIEPYAKASYRRAWQLSDRDLLRVRPLAYWRSQEGFGSTVDLDLDHLVSPTMMLRFTNWLNVSQDEEIQGVNWGSSIAVFQSFSDRRALTYRAMSTGETLDPVRVRNYGFELRYRQRILRKWLFIEYLTSVTWPKELPEEIRRTNWGVGVGLEMYFGPVPEEQMR